MSSVVVPSLHRPSLISDYQTPPIMTEGGNLASLLHVKAVLARIENLQYGVDKVKDFPIISYYWL